MPTTGLQRLDVPQQMPNSTAIPAAGLGEQSRLKVWDGQGFRVVGMRVWKVWG